MSYVNNLREKFPPGPGFKPGSPALRAAAITLAIHWAKLEFSSY